MYIKIEFPNSIVWKYVSEEMPCKTQVSDCTLNRSE